jgi:hypothetical protein
MTLQDFTISFTTTPVVEFNTPVQGGIGPISTVFAELPALNSIGPLGTVFADLPAFNSIGPMSTFSPLGLLGLITGDIIFYGEQGRFEADEVILPDGTYVLANPVVRTWGSKSQRTSVINLTSDRVLDVDESPSVCINNGVGTPIVVSLPDGAREGSKFTFVRTSSSGAMVVNTENDNGLILSSGLANASGISLDSIGAKLEVVSIGGDTWMSVVSDGVSVEATPTAASVSGILSTKSSLWLDASDVSNLTITASPDVDQWDDLSPQGSNLSQSDADRKPHTGGTINGLNALIFDGADDYLIHSTDGGLNGERGYVFVVMETAATGVSVHHTPFASASEATNVDYFLMRILADSSNGDQQTTHWSARDSSQNEQFYGNRGGTPVATGVPFLWTCSSDSNANFMQFDGVNQFIIPLTPSSPGKWFADLTGIENITVGNLKRISTLDAQTLNGKIGELIVLDGVNATDANARKVTQYLIDKWGL